MNNERLAMNKNNKTVQYMQGLIIFVITKLTIATLFPGC
jgi:hypothetical protein